LLAEVRTRHREISPDWQIGILTSVSVLSKRAVLRFRDQSFATNCSQRIIFRRKIWGRTVTRMTANQNRATPTN